MKARALPGYLYDTLTRLFPHRTRTGLRAVGTPGPDAPVLVTGNYTLTVRRLTEHLAGFDCWLLVADSRGINVWCAAGGGHLTHHDVIAAIRTSGVAERVRHREVVLPQLGATGIERRAITEATGWATRWGPARLEDLPAFLARGSRIVKRWRFMRFPAWERFEMAAVWALPMTLVAGPVFGILGGRRVLAATLLQVWIVVPGLFLTVPHWPVRGRGRWVVFAGAAAAGFGLAWGVLALLGGVSGGHLILAAVASVAAVGVLAVDFAGTTPWYPSYVNSFRNTPAITLSEDRCTGAAECVQVCPRDVLAMEGRRRKVRVARPDDCIACGACIVQCPEDALHFRYPDGRVVEAATIRSTRLNMMGRRTVHVGPGGPAR
ncbi:MAG: 4Fe-4S binding protein [Gemmatimonadetes bacterium]|nr:4Fe-4S binding protein [Gemmatimonadota bacterium]